MGLYFDYGMIRVRKWEKPKGSLAKGSWHAGGVTEGFTAATSNSHKSNVETQKLTENSSLREGAGAEGV